MNGSAAPAAAKTSLPDGGRFVALDSWRGIAALGVAVRHINGPSPLISGPIHDHLSLAVDFFFVLSGFVIAASYGERLTQGFSTLRFMVLRYGRVWPLHAALIGIYLVFEIAYALWGQGDGLAGRVPFTDGRALIRLLPACLLIDAYVFPGQSSWVTPSWSISVEIGLYFAVALLWRYAGRSAAVIALGFAIAALVLLDTGRAPDWYYVLRGIAGFGLGLAGWSLWRRIPRSDLPFALLAAVEVLALPLVLAAMWAGAPFSAVDLLFVLIVLVFAHEAGPVSRLLRMKPFVLLGTLSYSLYMVHGFVYGRIVDAIGLIQRLVGAHWVSWEIGGIDYLLFSPLVSTLLALAMLCASLLTAWLTWRFVEWPAREWSRRYARRFGAGSEEAQAPAI